MEKKPNWGKSVYFSMIADSRFDKNIILKIKTLHKKIKSKLRNKNKFKVYNSKIDSMTFENGKTKQKRIYYRVEINKSNTKLNDLYSLVNSVKPVHYGNRWRG